MTNVSRLFLQMKNIVLLMALNYILEIVVQTEYTSQMDT